jgi:hypothetical protein
MNEMRINDQIGGTPFSDKPTFQIATEFSEFGLPRICVITLPALAMVIDVFKVQDGLSIKKRQNVVTPIIKPSHETTLRHLDSLNRGFSMAIHVHGLAIFLGFL